MSRNCPNCGKQVDIGMEDVCLALLVEAGCSVSHRFEYCHCKPEEREKAETQYWFPNKMRGVDIWRLGKMAFRTFVTHRSPTMRDCVDLNYSYYVNDEGRVICYAVGDYYDITEDVMEHSEHLSL